MKDTKKNYRCEQRNSNYPHPTLYEPSVLNVPGVNHLRQPINRRTTTNDTNPILFAIVGLFTFGHILRLVPLYYNNSVTEFANYCIEAHATVTSICDQNIGINLSLYDVPDPKYPRWLWHINTVSGFLLCANSSLNFILYVFSGKRFRKTFWKKVSCVFSGCGYRSNLNSHPSMAMRQGANQTPGKF